MLTVEIRKSQMSYLFIHCLRHESYYHILEQSEKFKACSGCKSARFCRDKCRKNGCKKHEVQCKSIQILDEQNRNTSKILGDSNDGHMFNSYLTPLEHQK